MFAAVFAMAWTSQGQTTSEFFSKSDAFFKTNVTDGRVNYKAIKTNPNALNELLSLAASLEVDKEEALQYQAFWINAYNLLVIKGIVMQYPVKSPLDIPGFFDQTKHNIGGENISLNDIENKLLRANFKEEARFHFVLVCAGLGCPPIINRAYLPETLEDQLQTQTVKAINNPNFIQVSKNKVKVSQIFEWYNEDFVRGGKSLADFINNYKTDQLPEKAKITYYPYDWTLNDL